VKGIRKLKGILQGGGIGAKKTQRTFLVGRRLLQHTTWIKEKERENTKEVSAGRGEV